MVAPVSDSVESIGPRVGTFHEPPSPLPPELRSDIAHRRASGHPWDAIGCALHYQSDALRRVCENDPDFTAAQDKAWAEATWEGEADAMRRLRVFVNSYANENDDRALKAAEILVKYARERRRDDTRLACENLRAETKLAVEAARVERHAAKAQEEEVAYVQYPIPETPEETAKRAAREHTARSAEPDAEVYWWGGQHPLGREHKPDESDTKVRVKADWSCGGGGRFCPVYWVVPDPQPLKAAMPGEPDGPAAVAAWAAP